MAIDVLPPPDVQVQEERPLKRYVITPREALERLKEGNRKFASDEMTCIDTRRSVRAELVRGQRPIATVLACSDSRVPVELIFEQGLGTIFVVRLAGNVVDSVAIATIEFGLQNLGTPLLVVMGHGHCGAVTAAVDAFSKPKNERPKGDLGILLEKIYPAVEAAKKKHPNNLVNAAIQENVRLTTREILRRSEIVRDYVSTGKVEIAEGEFHLSTSEVEWLTPSF